MLHIHFCLLVFFIADISLLKIDPIYAQNENGKVETFTYIYMYYI